MANQEQLEILKQGVDVWNEWREENHDLDIDLEEASLVESDLKKINLNGANLIGADLGEVIFDRAHLMSANLNEAGLEGASLQSANLRGASLRGAHLYHANLNAAGLGDIDFSEADLREADLGLTNLRGANLNATDLNYANLRGADLRGATLISSVLLGAILNETDFRGATLSGARVGYTTFGKTYLSDVVGLEDVLHHSASFISTITLSLSKGKLPEKFLRGCGLSDLQIEQAKLTTPGLDPEQVTDITYKIHQLYLGEGIQYYSCFISYNSKDQDFAQRLYDDLQNNGVRCWFAPEDMKIGDQIRPTIDQQIRLRDKLLVILSENSVKSEWVGDEVEAALEEESASGRLVLFPIRLDNAVMDTRDDWAAKVKRRRHIGDFSNWKDERSYRKAFERLLRDLKSTKTE